jgi:hypothetical protein
VIDRIAKKPREPNYNHKFVSLRLVSVPKSRVTSYMGPSKCVDRQAPRLVPAHVKCMLGHMHLASLPGMKRRGLLIGGMPAVGPKL